MAFKEKITKTYSVTSLENIVGKLDSAVQVLKSKRGQFDWLTDEHIEFLTNYKLSFRDTAWVLKQNKRKSIDLPEDKRRDVLDLFLSHLSKDELQLAAPAIARYVYIPQSAQYDTAGLNRLAVILNNSQSKNFYKAIEEWNRVSFDFNELNLKQQKQCDACGQYSDEHQITLQNEKTGVSLTLGKTCFDHLLDHTGVLFEGKYHNFDESERQTKDSLVREIQSLFKDLTPDFIRDLRKTAEKLEVSELLTETDERLVQKIKDIYKFTGADDLMVSSREEVDTGFFGYYKQKISNGDLSEPLKKIAMKVVSNNRNTTLAEKLLLGLDYVKNRPISITAYSDPIKDLYYLEHLGKVKFDSANSDDQQILNNLTWLNITHEIGAKIMSKAPNYREERITHNEALLKKYGAKHTDNVLRKVLPVALRDMAIWAEEFKRGKELYEKTLSRKDYKLIKFAVEALTLGTTNISLNYDAEKLLNVLVNEVAMIDAKYLIEGLDVLGKKFRLAEKTNDSSALKQDFIPWQEFQRYTGINATIDEVVERLEQTLDLDGSNSTFLKNHIPRIQELSEYGLISKDDVYSYPADMVRKITEEELKLVKSTNEEIKKLDDLIDSTEGEGKKSLRKRRAVLIQKIQPITKGVRYGFIDDKGNRLDNKLNRESIELAWRYTKATRESYKTIEFLDNDNIQKTLHTTPMSKTLSTIIKYITNPLIKKITNMPRYFVNPEVLSKIKYVATHQASYLHTLAYSLANTHHTTNIKPEEIETYKQYVAEYEKAVKEQRITEDRQVLRKNGPVWHYEPYRLKLIVDRLEKK